MTMTTLPFHSENLRSLPSMSLAFSSEKCLCSDIFGFAQTCPMQTELSPCNSGTNFFFAMLERTHEQRFFFAFFAFSNWRGTRLQSGTISIGMRARWSDAAMV